MERKPELIASIIHFCVKVDPGWRLRVSADSLHECLLSDDQQEWTIDAIRGHIRLLADAKLIEIRSGDGGHTIERITWAGYDYLDSYEMTRLIRDNPFLRQYD